jgi:hypothetical protein
MIVGGSQSASNPYFNGPQDNIILARRYQRSASPIAMVTRQARLAEFPNPIDREGGVPFEILCEDHNGTYLLPFLCHWTVGEWRNAATGEAIDARVIGWRMSKGD